MIYFNIDIIKKIYTHLYNLLYRLFEKKIYNIM